MDKVILYYKFVPLADPAAIRLWQQNLAAGLGLKGRIIISPHGLNGTLGGPLPALKSYIKQTKQLPAFKDMVFKWSDGSTEHFPKLSVKVRSEIVTFGAGDELKVTNEGVVGGGKRLKPQQLHDLIRQRGDEVVLFDGRSQYEAAVGKFKNAMVPSVEHARDFAAELNDPKYDTIKDKPVVTYCTGGIRCEVLSALMKNRGFREVYQLDGGIASYGQVYGDDGLWEGALYVFDGRVTTKFSSRAKDIGRCVHCGHTTSNYRNCQNAKCNRQILVCASCQPKTDLCPDCVNSTTKPMRRPARQAP